MSRIYDIRSQMEQEKYEKAEKQKELEYLASLINQQKPEPPKTQKYKTREFWVEEVLKNVIKIIVGTICAYILIRFGLKSM